MSLVELLGDLANDDGAGRVGELLELAQMLIDGPSCAGALQWRADEYGAIYRRPECDQLFSNRTSPSPAVAA